MYAVAQKSGRPLPKFSDDDYVDFCVAEAVTLKGMKAEHDAQEKSAKEQEIKSWKNEWKKKK